MGRRRQIRALAVVAAVSALGAAAAIWRAATASAECENEGFSECLSSGIGWSLVAIALAVVCIAAVLVIVGTALWNALSRAASSSRWRREERP
jgi:hypothetical protein